MIAQMMISDADQQVHAACQRNCSENAECSCYSSKDDGYCKLGRNCEGLTYTGSSDDNRWVFGSCSGSTHMQTRSRIKYIRIEPATDRNANGWSVRDVLLY